MRNRQAQAVSMMVLGVGTLLARPAGAQQATPEERARFERGVAALADGRNGDALPDLLAAFEYRHAPVVLYNVGLAYRGLRRHQEAIDAFVRYLDNPAASAPATPEAIRIEARQLCRTLVPVPVTVEPAAAILRVDHAEQGWRAGGFTRDPDGRVREACRGVVSPGPGELVMDPGEHVISARHGGYCEQTRRMMVEPGQSRSLALTLERCSGNNWVLPVVIGGVAAVVAGVVIGVLLWEYRGTEPGVSGSWGNATEGIRVAW